MPSVNAGQVADGRLQVADEPAAARLGRTSARVCAIQGSAASIVAGVSRTPGMISRAKARVGGNAALSLSSAGLAASSTSRQHAHACARRSFCSAASAPVVMLKLVIRSLSWSSRLDERRGDLLRCP